MESPYQTCYLFQQNVKSWTKKTMPKFGKYGIRDMMKKKLERVTNIQVQLASKWLLDQKIKIWHRKLFMAWLIKVDFYGFLGNSFTQFLGFEFESSVGGVNLNQRLNCEVTVCHVDVCDSACMQGCFADNKCSILPSNTEETISVELPKTESFTHAVNMFQNTSRNNRKKQWLAFLKAANTASPDSICPLHLNKWSSMNWCFIVGLGIYLKLKYMILCSSLGKPEEYFDG